MDQNAPGIIQPENLIILEDNHADAHDEELVLDENTIILASGDTYSLIDMDALKAGIKKSGLSYEDIAEQRKISVSSIYKFFSKKSKSPSFYNTVMICKAAGVSLDAICGIHPTHKTPPQDEYRSELNRLCYTVSDLQKTVEAQSRLIEQLTAEMRRKYPAGSEDY